MTKMNTVENAPDYIPKSNQAKLSSANTFEKIIETSLKDTNAYGNIYYSKYFEYAGLIRETFYTTCVCDNDIEKIKSFIFATHEAHIKYCQDAYPFTVIKMTLNTQDIKKASCGFKIKFYDHINNVFLCESTQTLVIINPSTHKIIKTPDWIIERLKKYEIILSLR